MKNVRMLQQRVLLTPIPDEPISVGRLVVPETVARNIARGRIAAVDEGKLRVGDEVFYDTRQALPLNIDNIEFLIVHESQILLVLESKKKRKSE
jgi:co-chaperonin GroES (HSP10)